jgi:curved DNA-binding protein CbpA
MARDFYAVLAVPRNATEDQIRQRFRELARTRHPDRFQGEAKERAEVEFQEITQAFNVLSDPERRRRHDVELVRPEEQGAPDARQLARIYLQRGVKGYKEKNWAEAASNFDLATKSDPGNAQGWHHLAQACSHQRTWLPQGVAAIEQACQLEPMNPVYLKQAGRICALAGLTERALQYYRKALEWGGEDATISQAIDELTRSSPSSSRWGIFGKTG